MATAYPLAETPFLSGPAASDTVQLPMNSMSQSVDDAVASTAPRPLNAGYDLSNILVFRLRTKYSHWVHLEDRVRLFNYLIQYGLPKQLAEKITPVLYPHARAILLDDAGDSDKLTRISAVFESAVMSGLLAFDDNGATQSASSIPELPGEAPALYKDRANGEDAITFYRQTWLSQSYASQLTRAFIAAKDPDLIAAIQARCGYLKRARPEWVDDLAVGRDILGPDTRRKSPDVSETQPGTAERQLAEMRAADRSRKARARAKIKEPRA